MALLVFLQRWRNQAVPELEKLNNGGKVSSPAFCVSSSRLLFVMLRNHNWSAPLINNSRAFTIVGCIYTRNHVTRWIQLIGSEKWKVSMVNSVTAASLVFLLNSIQFNAIRPTNLFDTFTPTESPKFPSFYYSTGKQQKGISQNCLYSVPRQWLSFSW